MPVLQPITDPLDQWQEMIPSPALLTPLGSTLKTIIQVWTNATDSGSGISCENIIPIKNNGRSDHSDSLHWS